MTTERLFIPEKIKVGFCKREDTYTQKLAYVIYYDQKGVLRKEKSWQSWRDQKIKPIEFTNEPTEGFVLNKGVGGARHSYGWNSRNEYVRVYDPRDFEFEISVANLLFILRECDCSKGKGLEGKFVYAWDGTELVLLPVISEDYQNSKKFSELQGKKVKAKDIQPGFLYTTKKQEQLVYLGKFDVRQIVDGWNNKLEEPIVNKFVFWDTKAQKFDFRGNLNNVAEQVGDGQVANFAELMENYRNSPYNNKVVRLFLQKANKLKKPKEEDCAYEDWADYWYVEDNGVFKRYEEHEEYGYENVDREYFLQDGILRCRSCWTTIYKNPRHLSWKQKEKWIEPTKDRLFVELENGVILRFQHTQFEI